MDDLPYYKQIGAKSPQFADIGEKLKEMEWRNELLPEWGLRYLLRYLNHHEKGLKSIINDKNIIIMELKEEIRKLKQIQCSGGNMTKPYVIGETKPCQHYNVTVGGGYCNECKKRLNPSNKSETNENTPSS